MKKVFAFLVAALIAATTCACLIPASAGWAPVGDDLLEESGLGDPDYLAESELNIQGQCWVGHENWNTKQGYDGFQASDGYGNGPFTTAKTKSGVTLSNGSTGNVISFVNETDHPTGSEFAIENIDKICGFVDGETYLAKVVARVVQAPGNGHEFIVAWSNKSCTANSNRVVIPTDGEWHEITLAYTYDADTIDVETPDGDAWGPSAAAGNRRGDYLYLGCCENWIPAGTEVQYESIKIYKAENDGFVFNLKPEDLTLAGSSWPDQPGQYGSAPYTVAGILKPGDGGATSSVDTTRTIVDTALSDGSTGKAFRFANDGTATDKYCSAGNVLKNLPALKSNTTYTFRVIAKVTNSPAMGDNTSTNFDRYYYFGLGGEVTEANVQTAIADGQWHTIEYTFTTKGNVETVDYGVILGCYPGSAFFYEGFEVLIENIALYEGSEIPVVTPPTGDAAIVAAIVFAVVLAAAVVFTKKRAF